MALIECPDCKKEMSDRAPACPHCGCPLGAAGKVASEMDASGVVVPPALPSTAPERARAEPRRPSVWRRHIRLLAFGLPGFVIVGAVVIYMAVARTTSPMPAGFEAIRMRMSWDEFIGVVAGNPSWKDNVYVGLHFGEDLEKVEPNAQFLAANREFVERSKRMWMGPVLVIKPAAPFARVSIKGDESDPPRVVTVEFEAQTAGSAAFEALCSDAEKRLGKVGNRNTNTGSGARVCFWDLCEGNASVTYVVEQAADDAVTATVSSFPGQPCQKH